MTPESRQVEAAQPARPPAAGTALERAGAALHAAVQRLNAGVAALCGVMLLGILVVTIWEVWTRYVLRNPATWTYPVASYLLVFVVYLGAGQALERDAHIRVDGVVRALFPRRLRLFEAVSAAIGAAFVAVFAWEGWLQYRTALIQGQHDESILRWPLAPIVVALPAGLALLLLTYLALAADRFRYLPPLPGVTMQASRPDGEPASEPAPPG